MEQAIYEIGGKRKREKGRKEPSKEEEGGRVHKVKVRKLGAEGRRERTGGDAASP